jgi:hypothetical protein
MIGMLFMACFLYAEAYGELRIDTVSPFYGITGQPLEITVSGSGFGPDTRVTMVPEGISRMVDTGGQAIDLEIGDGFACVADSLAGLKVIDIRDPAFPRLSGELAFADMIWDIQLSGTTVYAATSLSGVMMIDVTKPASPAVSGNVKIPASRDLSGYEDILRSFASDYEETWGMDIESMLMEYLSSMADDNLSTVSVLMKDNLLITGDYPDYVHLIDITDRSSPVILSAVNISLAHEDDWESWIYNYDPYYTNMAWPSGMALQDNILFIADNMKKRLLTVDISDRAQPVILDDVTFPDSPVKLAVEGNYAYVTVMNKGLFVIDAGNPSDLRIVSKIDNISGYGIALKDGKAYVSASNLSCRVHEADIRNPAVPAITDSFQVSECPYQAVPKDGLLYVAGGKAGLTILPLPKQISPVTVQDENHITFTLTDIRFSGTYGLRIENDTDKREKTGAVTFSEPVSKAIIIAGGGPSYGTWKNGIWEETLRCANYAYLALIRQGYRPEDIHYLNPITDIDVDADGTKDADASATRENVKTAITEWGAGADLPVSELLIYMVDHGGDRTFRLNAQEMMSAGELDEWLDAFQTVSDTRVILVYDACQSGTFLPELTPIADRERIVITGASDESAVFLLNGMYSFSYQFWSAVFGGDYLDDAFYYAKDMMETFQTARMDANGNGIPNELSDQRLADRIVIGKGLKLASDLPQIDRVCDPQTITGISADFWAGPVTDADGIQKVWAVITPPGYMPDAPDIPITDLPVFELTDGDADDIFEGTYRGFCRSGIYSIQIYASDTTGMFSLPGRTSVTGTGNETACIKGDINGDCLADLSDVLTGLKILSGENSSGLIRTDYGPECGDVNGDGKAGMEEVLYVLKHLSLTAYNAEPFGNP